MAINAEKLYELATANLLTACINANNGDEKNGNALFDMAKRDPYALSSVPSINVALEIFTMAKDELGKAKGGTAYSAFKRIIKRSGDVRRNLAGVWKDSEGRSCVCDGYLAIRLKKPVSGFEECQGVDLDKIFPNGSYFTDPVELSIPTPGELKINSRKVGNYRGAKAVYDFGSGLPMVDAALLKDVMDCLPGAKAVTENHTTTKMLYFTSDAGDAILLPVRKTA